MDPATGDEGTVQAASLLGAAYLGIRALEVHGMVLARDGHHDLARAAYQEGLDRVGLTEESPIA